MSQSSAFKSKRAGRWVTIRLKVLFSILITLICVFLVINFVVEPIITGNIAQQEKEDTEGKVRQAQAVLLNELSDLSNVAEGWASRDDTYWTAPL
jgi:sensor domain CHASE-containing protein